MKNSIKIFKKVGFNRGNIDLCLYTKKSVKGFLYIALHVHDNLMVGNLKTTDEAKETFESMG